MESNASSAVNVGEVSVQVESSSVPSRTTAMSMDAVLPTRFGAAPGTSATSTINVNAGAARRVAEEFPSTLTWHAGKKLNKSSTSTWSSALAAGVLPQLLREAAAAGAAGGAGTQAGADSLERRNSYVQGLERIRREPSATAAIQTAYATLSQMTQRQGELAAQVKKAADDAKAAAASATVSDEKGKQKQTDAASKKKVFKKEETKEFQMDEHRLPTSEVLARYSARVDLENVYASEGLTSADVAKLQAVHGKNALSPPKQTPEWVKYLRGFLNFFMLLLQAAGILSLIAYGLSPDQKINLYVGVILLGVVFCMVTIAYLQDRSTSNLMNSFKNLLPPACRVRRDGVESKVPAATLVPGDLVILQTGSKVPADILVLEGNSLKVDNSSLTGECEPQSRTNKNVEENALEATNVVWYGTLVLDGEGIGIVIRTGDHTLIGQIAHLTSNTEQQESTMQLEVKLFVKKISILAIVMGLIFLILGFILGYGWLFNVLAFIGVVVANVPEGLPATVTACLSLAAKRMSQRNVWCKRLEVVETLGSVTAIASDKTGTLTENRMTVNHLWYDASVHHIDDSVPSGKYNIEHQSCVQLVRVASLCNRAQFDAVSAATEPDINKRLVNGDASETAFLRFCEALFSVENLRKQHPKKVEIPFNSKDKYQLSVHELPDRPDELLIVFKGGPDIVLSHCGSYLHNGSVVPKDDAFLASFTQTYEQIGSMGERVLACAELIVPRSALPVLDQDSARAAALGNLTLVGLIALIDPPRAAVPSAVAACRRAGIRVMMVTGDHPFTAKAIGQMVGIITLPTADDIAKDRGCRVEEVPEHEVQAVVIHGHTLSKFTEADWDRVLSKPEVIFARTAPQQKLIIVEHLQKRGEIVAVTGDGVNDAPALKQANVGCAMGIVGSDVAKEAADIVLLDDNFSSIVNGIEEGRTIFDNLRKSCAYTLTHAVPEIVPFLLNIVFGFPNGLTAVLVLLIDLGTELAPAISLAYEPAEGDVMFRKPRSLKDDRLVTKQVFFFSYLQVGVIEFFACFASFAMTFISRGIPLSALPFTAKYWQFGSPDLTINGTVYSESEQIDIMSQAQTAYWQTLVTCQLFNILANKTRSVSVFTHGFFGNVTMIYGMFTSIAFALFIIYVPPLHDGLLTRDVGWTWLIGMAFGVFIFAYNELRKLYIRRNPDTKVSYWLNW